MKTFKTFSLLILACILAAPAFAQNNHVNITLANFTDEVSEDGRTVTLVARLSGSDVRNIGSIEMILDDSEARVQTVVTPTVISGNGNTIQVVATFQNIPGRPSRNFTLWMDVTDIDSPLPRQNTGQIGVKLTAAVTHF